MDRDFMETRTQKFHGSRLIEKLAARITFYNINNQVPTEESPVVYDAAHYKFYINPNGGFAKHYQIYDYMQDKGYPAPPGMGDEAHGYYYPEDDRFAWNPSPYFKPNENLENAFRSGIKLAVPTPRGPKGNLAKFKWATAGGDPEVSNKTTRRPVIYWVNQDTVYLGQPYGQHYEIYEDMYEDGFDDHEGSGDSEVHGYYNYSTSKGDMYWYEPGAYGYQVNRLPTPEEEVRIRATIENALKISPTSKLQRRASMLPLG